MEGGGGGQKGSIDKLTNQLVLFFPNQNQIIYIYIKEFTSNNGNKFHLSCRKPD